MEASPLTFNPRTACPSGATLDDGGSNMASVLIAIGSAFGGAIGAMLGWMASAFVGSPVRKFFDLRGEIIRRMTEFANVRARWKEIPDDVGAISGNREDMGLSDKEIERLESAQATLRDLAAQMRAFAENETLALWFITRLRYDPAGASAALIGLSNTYDTYGKGKAWQKQMLGKALKVADL
jgi:hypothetical protein